MYLVKQPIKRSKLRLMMGHIFYGIKRKMIWIKLNHLFAKKRENVKLPYSYFEHKTILMRKLKDVDMWMQRNKVTNLKNAVKRLDGILIHPGEIFSYWRLIGKPSKRKGYVKGMVLRSGKVVAGTGGGLCQLSNLIFWMTIHTPLTVIERHRHGYDVFPDSSRTQPFGSGATCFYLHGDLMIRNDTQDTYQLVVTVGEKYLEGEWRVSSEPEYRFEIVERNHEMRSEFWGGYTRHNELYQKKYDSYGDMVEERLIVKNSAIMMYSPFIEHKE